mgnify:FL=1
MKRLTLLLNQLEQAEYEREKISWNFIEFPDNQDCLDLIAGKQYGILAMLDDECKLPKGSDKKFAARLYTQFGGDKNNTNNTYNSSSTHSHNTQNKIDTPASTKSNRFTASAKQVRDLIFCVKHFAGVVAYTAESGFVEKNKDELPIAARDLFTNTEQTSDLILEMFAAEAATKTKKTMSIGGQFKEVSERSERALM